MSTTREMLEMRLHPDAPSGGGSVLQNHPTRSATTIDGWKSVLFGLPFLAAGVFIGFVANGSISGQKEAPDWLIWIMAGMFFSAGAFLAIHGVRGAIRKARYLRAAALNPGQPWLYDFHWSQEGIKFSAFDAMLGRLVAALIWSIFLVPFFWIGLAHRGAWLFTVVASIFALVGLIFWYRWAQMLADLIFHGNSYLSYDSFPYFLGGNFRARLRAPNHLAAVGELKLTLRCVQEKYVTSGTGEDRTSQVVCYELCSQVTTIPSERLAGYAGAEIPMEFRLPADQPTTNLAATPPTYWEIEARGESGVVSYEAYFLVPVYKPA